jgi:hypothetical protein
VEKGQARVALGWSDERRGSRSLRATLVPEGDGLRVVEGELGSGGIWADLRGSVRAAGGGAGLLVELESERVGLEELPALAASALALVEVGAIGVVRAGIRSDDPGYSAGWLRGELRLRGARGATFDLEGVVGGGGVAVGGSLGAEEGEVSVLLQGVQVDERLCRTFAVEPRFHGCAEGTLDWRWGPAPAPGAEDRELRADFGMLRPRPEGSALAEALARDFRAPWLRRVELDRVSLRTWTGPAGTVVEELRFASEGLRGSGAGVIGPGEQLALDLDARLEGPPARSAATEPGLGPILLDAEGGLDARLRLRGTFARPRFVWDREARVDSARLAAVERATEELRRNFEEAMGLPEGALRDPMAGLMDDAARRMRAIAERRGRP